MANQLTDIDLCRRAVQVLAQTLGPVDTLRFLSMVRAAPRDYIRWRDEHFGRIPTDEILDDIERMDQA